MIGIGSIEYGPEITRRPIAKSIRQLNRTLVGGQILVEIVFVIPGRLGKADFKGFKVRRGTADGPIVIFAEVSSSLASAVAPMPGLIQLAKSALEAAAPLISSAARPDGRAVDVDELKNVLDVAGPQLSAPPPYPSSTRRGRCSAAEASSRPTLSIEPENDDERAGVEVHLRVNDQRAINAAFELQALIEGRLELDAAGYVDGNEVGEGEFTIYVYGPDIVPLRESVEAIIRDRWHHPGVRLRLLDHEVEVETVSIKP